MSAGIDILKRIVQTIGIPVKRLRIYPVGNNTVRADKPSNRRVVVAGVIVIEAGVIEALAGEEPVRSYVAGTIS